MDWRGFFFSTSGRLGRAGYARGVLLANLYAQLCFVAACFTTIVAGRWAVVPFSLMFLGLAPAVILTVRRLHDRGKRGWWAIPFLIGPFCAELAITALQSRAAALPAMLGLILALVLALAAVALWFWSTLELWWIPGQSGPNRYGPDTLLRRVKTQ